MTSVSLDAIRADDRCQPRTTFDNDLVAQYAEAMAHGAVFPPVTVFFDGVDYFLADGFHRYHAAKSLGLADLAATVKDGTIRDAILFSCSANADHGWRRTNDDKRRAVLRLLNDAEWVKWSDREIARQCGVSHEFVRKLRPEPSGNVDRYVQRGGTVYQQNTANIGSAPRPRPDVDAPVFDNTPTGESWRDKAAPAAVVAIDSLNRETALVSALHDIAEIFDRLPPALDAADRFPGLVLYTVDPTKLRAFSRWLADFAAEIQIRKDHRNVAAE